MHLGLLSDRSLFYGWVIVAVCFTCLGLGYAVWYSFTVFFLAVTQEFGVNRATMSLALSLFILTHGVSGPVVGTLTRRFGARRVMPFGALLLAIALAATSMIQEPWQFYVTFGLFAGLGLGAIGMVPSYAVVFHWFRRRRGLAFGIMSAGVGAVGILVMVPVDGYLITVIGWRGAYLVTAAVIAVVIPGLVVFLMRERPEDMGLLSDGADAPNDINAGEVADAAIESQEDDGPTAGDALRTCRFWGLALAVMLMVVVSQAFLAHAAPYLVDLGHSVTFAASVVGLVGLTSVGGKIGWGHVFDRLGCDAGYAMGASCTVSSMVLLILLPSLSGVWPIYLATFLFALGYSAQTVVAPKLTADMFGGKHYGTIYGWISLANNVGGATGPWFAGYIFDRTGSYASAFLTCAVAIIAACAIVCSVVRRRGRQITGSNVHYSDLHKY